MFHRIASPWFVAAALALGVSACGPGFRVNTPDGFVELDDQEDYDYRATSAQGVVLGVRAEPNRPVGNLEFWASAIDLKLRAQGYTATGTGAFKTTGGITGKRLQYKQTLSDRPHTLWVVVFVTEKKVYVVEAGGDTRVFDKSGPAIEKAIASLVASG
jgi:hypothetical protein